MSRTNKLRRKKLLSKSTKGAKKTEASSGIKKSQYPGDQPAPSWLKSTSKKGWWRNKQKRTNSSDQ